MRMRRIADSPKINVKLHNNEKNYIDIDYLRLEFVQLCQMASYVTLYVRRHTNV